MKPKIAEQGIGSITNNAQAATAKYHKLGGLVNRNLFPRNSVGWKSKIELSV